MSAPLTFPCLKETYNNTAVYVMLCNAKLLRTFLQVNRKVEDKDEGYQRAFSLARARDIGRYLDAGGIIPGSIIINLDEADYSPATRTLTIPNKEGAGWVVDGQHRLEGAAMHSSKDIFLPVTAFIGLPERKQIDLFVTINKEQKGVSSSLYLDLLKRLPGKVSEKEALQIRATDLADIMKKDPESVFFRRLVSTSAPKNGQLSITNFVRKVTPLIKESGVLSGYPDETRAKMLSNLFGALLELSPKHEDVFFKTLGFGAILNAFPTIHQLILSRTGPDFTIVSFKALLGTIDYFDFGSWKTAGTGSAGEIAAGRDLIESLQKSNPVEVKL